MESWIAFAVAVVAAIVAGFLLAVVAAIVVRAIGRRRGWEEAPTARVRAPFRLFTIVVLLWIAVDITFPLRDWLPPIDHGFRIVAIAIGAWLAVALLGVFFEQVQGRYRIDVRDNRVARRMRTQLTILRRLAAVIISVLAVGAILLTFPGVQAAGASVLASAGVLSIVAGLAAQSTLSNVFAGMQLAFSDAIRVDDVVIAEGEWGRIEEITLTYVVVHIWDDRRLVLPSTYFTSTPFQNWTRRNSELLGSVEIDLDWRVSPARMREELDRILAETTLWDGRVKVLQVTDAVGGTIRIRILVTAVDAPTLFDLRCHVREQFVEWVHRESPEALPLRRIQMVQPPQPSERDLDHRPPATEPVGLFSGSSEAEQRAASFTGTIPLPDTEAAEPEPDSRA